MNDSRFHGQVCVVTGAAGGIGEATARALHAEGAHVALLDRDETRVTAVAASLGERAIALACDVSDPTSVKDAEAAVSSWAGAASVLVNGAGILAPGPLGALPVAEWNRLIAVNLTGAFLCAQIFGAGMRAAGHGAMVHIASIGGTHATPHTGAYSVAKAGIIMLSRQLALEWASSGIRSNVISPGLIKTPMTDRFYDLPGMTEKRSAMIPRGRIGTPEDIAKVAVFLAGPDADYINGQELVVDGGLNQALLSLLPRPGFEDA